MITESVQSGYALVLAALVTGFCAWVAQRAKSQGEKEEQELNLDVQNRKNLIDGYREMNKQLQDQVTVLQTQVNQLWATIATMQRALEMCERSRIDDIRRIGELEKLVGKLPLSPGEPEKDFF